MYLYVGHKIRSGKCEGPGRGDRSVKEPELGGRRGKELEWEMRRTGRTEGGGGVDGVKNWSGKCGGPGGGGSTG